VSRHVTFIAWDEVAHLSGSDKESMAAAYAPHER